MTKIIVGFYDEAGNVVFEEREPDPVQDAHEWWEKHWENWKVDCLMAVPPYEPPDPPDQPKRRKARSR